MSRILAVLLLDFVWALMQDISSKKFLQCCAEHNASKIEGKLMNISSVCEYFLFFLLQFANTMLLYTVSMTDVTLTGWQIKLSMVNTPIPHSLRAESLKAAKILRDFTMPSAKTGPDKIIPGLSYWHWSYTDVKQLVLTWEILMYGCTLFV